MVRDGWVRSSIKLSRAMATYRSDHELFKRGVIVIFSWSLLNPALCSADVAALKGSGQILPQTCMRIRSNHFWNNLSFASSECFIRSGRMWARHWLQSMFPERPSFYAFTISTYTTCRSSHWHFAVTFSVEFCPLTLPPHVCLSTYNSNEFGLLSCAL